MKSRSIHGKISMAIPIGIELYDYRQVGGYGSDHLK